jgi:nucleoside 2-deoxyribosyltransferase
MSLISGLVAYPSEPRDIGQTISKSLEKLHSEAKFKQLRSWEETDIPGRFIATEVLKLIENGSIFIADVTRLNFNVVFEIGYAIGSKKRTFLLRNEIIQPELDVIRQVGIFDTLGYATYNDSGTFISVIEGIQDLSPLHFDEKIKNDKTPVYVLLPQIKGDFETHLIARIKKGRLFYKSFDAAEQGRLSAPDAIENVAESHGVVVPLLPGYYNNANVHNFRAAFIAGLAQGMRKLLLLLQNGEDPIPLDYRDLVRSFKFPNQIDEYVNDFALSVFESTQSSQPTVVTHPSNFLAQLTLGASSAENEFQELSKYYLETDEFRRTLRGEIQIVLGRKGSGKTALFFQVRDRIRPNKNNVVLDLKPEGFQLIKFKEQVLDYLEKGTREHTITAFWEYLLLLEICHKLLDNDKTRYLRDHELYSPYQGLASVYNNDEYVSEGDFAERMLKLTRKISDDFEAMRHSGGSLRLSKDQITNFIYCHDIAALQSKLATYLKYKDALWILFDNLDKGWPPHGIGPDDVLSLRCLLDAIAKIEHSLGREGIKAKGILFIRNDVYEHLVDVMPDRGKISYALVDWNDEALLLELLRRRFMSSGIEENPPMENIWPRVCVSHIHGEESSHYMVERCLMRPRSLIDFLRYCRSHAVNLGHSRIEVEDIENGEEQYSTQLVNDISYEIQDVFPPAKNVLYELIESNSELDSASLNLILAKISPDPAVQEKTLDILVWYGVIGFRKEEGNPTYIYSVRYDMKRIKALMEKRAHNSLVYLINPAFWKGLEIKK